jgi:MFS superfamily sulfate permease-like transporter
MNTTQPQNLENSTRTEGQKNWQQDLLASLVVFLVALPLCMGIALASGAPIAAGLVTGIIGGLVVGIFAGSPLQVSGPAAGLTVICGEIIRQNGMPAFGLAVLFAGGFQLVAGLCRLGQWFRAVSPAVIHGMLSGIGILILCGQLHVLVDARPRETALLNLMALPQSLMEGLKLPERESLEIRTAHIGLLRQANALANRQRALKGDVERSLIRLQPPNPDPFHEHTHLTDRDILSALHPFIAEQELLLKEFGELMTAARSPAFSSPESSSRNGAVFDRLTQAEQKLAMAVTQLSDPDLTAVARSQRDATTALDLVTAGLKSHEWAGKIGLLAVGVIIAWQFLARGKMKLIPAPLLAIIVATVVAQLLHVPVLYVDVPSNLISGLSFVSLSVLEQSPLRQLIGSGLVIAMVASAETLLCATAVDQMHRGPRTRYDRELAAQGLGNLLCGWLGVLPMTGVIVRSAANVQAGAKTRLSAILHGVWLLLFSVALVPVLRMIPTSALAGILVFTGFRLIDYRSFLRLWKENRVEAGIFLITMLTIVAADLLIGVVTGIVLSAAKLLFRFSELEVEMVQGSEADAGRTTIRLRGAATFLRLPILASRLEKVAPGAELHLQVSELEYIDRACLELLQNWSRQHNATGGSLVIDWDALKQKFQTSKIPVR